MTPAGKSIRDFLRRAGAAIHVEVAEAKGSTPRETGTWMLVSADAIFGTIGGGQLEFLAIDHARRMLAEGRAADRLDVPLGPDIGQCCGGRAALALREVDDGLAGELADGADADHRRLPHVYLFGAGHVGHALAEALALLPLRVVVADNRQEAIGDLGDAVEARLTAVPESIVREAPAGSAFVVLTHEHALDFLITGEALKRGDAAYVGMIGSKTKKETFRRWFSKNGGGDARFEKLVCPIGGSAVRDKRPAVIAALAAAEIVTALSAVARDAPAPVRASSR